MKKIFFLMISVVAALTVSAAEKTSEQTVKPQFSKWSVRSPEKGVITCDKQFVKISAPLKKTAMLSVNNLFAIKPFDKVTLKLKFKGKGTIQLGFHVYSDKKYLTTFDGYRLLAYSPEKFTQIEYTHYVPSDEGKYKPMKKAIPCVYLYPGTVGELEDFQWKIEKFSLDENSPLSKTPPVAGTLKMQRQLILPEAFYAVAGLECNVYFRNIFLTKDPEEYVFKVNCAKGESKKDKWSFVPGEGDAGTYNWSISISDKIGNLLAEKKATLYVAPGNAGNGKNYSLLMFGDSIIGVTSFPKRVHALFKTPGNPVLTMVGTRPRKVAKGGMMHEGFPGWSWYYFTNKGPFVKQKEGYPLHLDVQGYLNRVNEGKAPDFITVQLGVNDVFGRDDFRLPSVLKAVEQRMDKLVSELRKCAPDAVIALAYPTPASVNRDMTKTKLTAAVWRYQQNLFEYNYLLQKKFTGKNNDRKILLVPVGTSLDCEKNFDVKDHVHPTVAGGNQLGDALYAFLKYQMSIKK